jgi:two-component system, NarL family, sensor histidine kinase UhpB
MQPLRLLVVEDSEDDYLLLLARLKGAGYVIARCLRVETGEALTEALNAESWDAVISDHRLPHFNSAAALPVVKRADPDLPFLIVSAAIGEEAAVEAMQAGADDYVMKDRLARLAPALQRAIDRAADRKHQRLAEFALKESEARFRSLTGNLPGMVFQMHITDDGAFKLPFVSDGAERLFHVAPDLFVRAPHLLLDLLAAEMRDEFTQRLAEAARTQHDLHWECRSDPTRVVAAQWLEFAASARTLAAGGVLWDGIVSDITRQKRAELDMRESQQQLRDLAAHVVRVREEEREAVARELHDDIGSTLTALKFDLAWLRGQVQASPEIAERFVKIARLVSTAIEANTRIVRNLRPGVLEFGIVASLEAQADEFGQRMNIPCEFTSDPEELDLDRERALTVYRICQEALTNIAKYAQATAVRIQVNAANGALKMRIVDNGQGFEAEALAAKRCFGILGMRERALSLGGTLDVHGILGKGTTVELTLPLG